MSYRVTVSVKTSSTPDEYNYFMPETKAEARAADDGYTAYRARQTEGRRYYLPARYTTDARLTSAFNYGWSEARADDNAENC